MNIAETLRGLVRRWYIVLPGALLAAGAALAVWTHTPPTYQRTATQMLLPGEASMPVTVVEVDGEEVETEPNPFLYLGGLGTAADVLVRVAGAEASVAEVLEPYDGAEVQVARDHTSSAPMILITASAADDGDAARIVDEMLQRTEHVFGEIQDEQEVSSELRMSIWTVAVSSEGTLSNRDRLMAAGLTGAGSLLLVLLVAAAVDGLARRPRRKRAVRGDEPDDTTTGAEAVRSEVTTAEEDEGVDVEVDVDEAIERMLVEERPAPVPARGDGGRAGRRR
ncbi:hypothetical protein [Microbacterium sp. Marseille-Q6965]|uniref:hypothetical protein n=1 Tax=Microbacterium sp. Marseille-Q6965 TaxID=2965072 RepID=UPI0021B6E8B0|nr:hypothetical protein [Microbacterium sp. Marseille-Q6965]